MMIQKYMPVRVPQSVDESLRVGGLGPEEVEMVILSHLHFDQYGFLLSYITCHRQKLTYVYCL